MKQSRISSQNRKEKRDCYYFLTTKHLYAGFWILLKISPETKAQDKFHFYISENLLEYTLKQEYNKIEYTSNVEYTNYYSSNLNTGTFPLKTSTKK